MSLAVHVSALTKRYGSRTALQGLDLTVPAGSVFGLIGPNGAGKTTTLRILLDIIRPTSGQVRVLGVDPRRGGPALRRRIGYLPGELRLDGRPGATPCSGTTPSSADASHREPSPSSRPASTVSSTGLSGPCPRETSRSWA